jgi:hypothetical protein
MSLPPSYFEYRDPWHISSETSEETKVFRESEEKSSPASPYLDAQDPIVEPSEEPVYDQDYITTQQLTNQTCAFHTNKNQRVCTGGRALVPA